MAFSKKEVGMLAFVAGLFVAFFLALVQPGVSQTTQIMALGLLGISIGLLNVDVKEMEAYMIASVALVFCASVFAQVLDQLPVISGLLERLLANLLYIIVPGVVLIALRIVFEASKSQESLPSPLRTWRAVRPKRKAAKKRRKR
jgi:xanthosine utilization system XapX-like protein